MSTVAVTRAQIESSIKSNLEDFLVLLHKAFFEILMYGDIDMFINIINKC